MLADLSQLGPGASGTGPLPQRVFLQVLLQLRLPEEEFCHVICEEHRERLQGARNGRCAGNPRKDLGTTTPSLHAPSKALLELHNRVQVGTTLR